MDEATNQAVMTAIEELTGALLRAVDVLERIGRRLHPPDLATLVTSTRDVRDSLEAALSRLHALDPPAGHREDLLEGLAEAADHSLAAFSRLAEAPGQPDAPIRAYRALREQARALEALYPLAPRLPAVSRFFLEPDWRDAASLMERLAGSGRPREGTGIMHHANERERRGGYSLYVPEYYDGSRPLPLIVALHGGSGHGADFLWNWLREARTRGVILVSPTSLGRTWSLRGQDVDTPRIIEILKTVERRWRVDSSRLLLTGMSDGGTFIYISALREGSPFTHLAPCSASFHPGLLDRASPGRLAGLPIYITHGELDWMFSVDFAHIASAALRRAGARVVLRTVPDLSHTYPRDESPRIMDWFLG